MKITISTYVNASLEKVWNCWTEPSCVIQWNAASDDWHTTKAENDLLVGGKFNYRMEAKDGSFGFDFWGIYSKIIPQELIEITLGDERKVWINFSQTDEGILVEESFEAEDENSAELQKNGWQAILNNFKKHVEKLTT